MQERGGPRPFDVATRGLIETDPAGWLVWLGLPANGPAQPVDSEVSAVLAAVDKVLRVEAPSPWLAHVEFQVSRDPRLPRRLLQYHAILLHRHGLPVATTVVLLRPSAASRGLNGLFEQQGPMGEITVSFRYRVVRLWDQPVEALLNGSLGTLPLAPLADLDQVRLPDVLDRLEERFTNEAPSAVGDLWAATALLMGVRYDRETIRGLMQRVRRMRESVTYQIILEEGIEEGRERGREEGREEGRVDEARALLLDLGAEKLGAPDAATASVLDTLDDLPRLQRMARAVLRASTWQEILAAGQG